ncbi:hypothetical protein [Rhizobium rhizogenes]|uniref:hypothetical protein n=1 Tax=Rhizobium rhizogenes TaxID=359 RepID=UPI001574E51F|nr:hypothetical protein [Rhizobium rhizogenes]NTF65996.1 hypothetical protein [Rhizobium rhizogenes]NTG97381.1 hypothetical protein [Rhizobium rhizogenes]
MSAENQLRPPASPPTSNPFTSGAKEVQIQQKTVKTRTTPRELMDSNAGEVGAGVIHVIEGVDEEHFVEALTDGVRAAFDLGDAGYEVFKVALVEYQQAKISDGRCDSLTLFYSDDQLNGKKTEMNETQFQFGLKELLSKGVLSQKAPDQYWLNQALFFNGSGVILIKEYRLLPANLRNV